MVKGNGWPWLKEKLTEALKINMGEKSSNQFIHDDIDYHELFGVKKISAERHDDQYYHELLGIIKMPQEASLSNVQAREWYLYYMAKIPEALDKTVSLEEQSMQASQIRGWIRDNARRLMADRKLAAELDQYEPNLTYNQMRQKQKDRGLDDLLIHEGVIRSSFRFRETINNSLGVKKPRNKEIDPLLAQLVKTPSRYDREFENRITQADSLVKAPFENRRDIADDRQDDDSKVSLNEFVRLVKEKKGKMLANADSRSSPIKNEEEVMRG